MTKNPSDLPSQGAAFLAAVERQQRDWQTFNRALAKGPLARDVRRITDAIEMERKRRDLAFRALTKSPGVMAVERMVRVTELHQRRFAALGRAVAANTIATNVGRDCRRIAATLQAQQVRALKTQRLLVRSAAFQALEQINRATKLQQRQLKSIVRTVGNNSFAYAIKQMSLTLSRSAFVKDLRRITAAARLMQAQTDSAHRALRASLDLSPLAHLRASFPRGLRPSLIVAAESAPVASPQDAQEVSRATSENDTATAGPPNAIGAVSEEAHCEWRIKVFLAKLPAYFEPRDKLLSKLRRH